MKWNPRKSIKTEFVFLCIVGVSIPSISILIFFSNYVNQKLHTELAIKMETIHRIIERDIDDLIQIRKLTIAAHSRADFVVNLAVAERTSEVLISLHEMVKYLRQEANVNLVSFYNSTGDCEVSTHKDQSCKKISASLLDNIEASKERSIPVLVAFRNFNRSSFRLLTFSPVIEPFYKYLEGILEKTVFIDKNFLAALKDKVGIDLALFIQKEASIYTTPSVPILDPSTYQDLIKTKKNVFQENILIDNHQYYLSLIPLLQNNGAVFGAIGLLGSKKYVRENQKVIFTIFTLSIVAVLIFTLSLIKWSTMRLTRPILSVVEVLRTFGKGKLKKRVNFAAENEIGELARSFNIMASDLEKTRKEKDKLLNNLQQVQKMEAIGTLAGGIAHDFNNILTSIIGYSELNLGKFPLGSKTYADFKQILDSGFRARDLVRQILTFSRQHEHTLVTVSLAPIVEEALKFMRSSLPTHIKIQQNLDGQSSTIQGDITQIHQIIMNLCINAEHAMRQKGGVLEVNLKPVHLDAPFCSIHFRLKEGDYLKLSVSDTGHGMSKKIMDRIFDPFFTTKGVGEGTGMGLSTVHGIVLNHGGEIIVNSELGKGTNFDIYLPKSEDIEIKGKTKSLTIPRGNERILFVDDEEGVAKIGQEMLESLGYEVL